MHNGYKPFIANFRENASLKLQHQGANLCTRTFVHEKIQSNIFKELLSSNQSNGVISANKNLCACKVL